MKQPLICGAGAVGACPALTAQDIAAGAALGGLRPCSSGGLPYIGRFARYSNLCVAAGRTMLDISLAPRIALEPLSPQRYQ